MSGVHIPEPRMSNFEYRYLSLACQPLYARGKSRYDIHAGSTRLIHASSTERLMQEHQTFDLSYY